MNKQVEESGEHINLYLFEFGKDGEDAKFVEGYDGILDCWISFDYPAIFARALN